MAILRKGMPFAELFATEDREEARIVKERILAGKQTVCPVGLPHLCRPYMLTNSQIPMRRKDKRPLWVHTSLANGEYDGHHILFAFIRDTSGLRAREGLRSSLLALRSN